METVCILYVNLRARKCIPIEYCDFTANSGVRSFKELPTAQSETVYGFNAWNVCILEYDCHMGVQARPDIFLYDNYRRFLGDWYQYEKSNVGFSFREFSQRAGFKSPNFVKLIIDGKRNVTLNSIRKLILALHLSAEEGSFFKSLVMLNQAKSGAERTSYTRELLKFKVFRELHPLKGASLEFYECWYSIPLREMIASPLFREDFDWIAGQFLNIISANQVRAAIENMLLLGVIQRDANGKLIQASKNISTGDELESAMVAGFHKQMMTLASESIDTVKRHRRDISGITLAISEGSFSRIKELVQSFRKSLLAEADAFEGEKAIYQVNFQVFPLTRFFGKEDDQASYVDEGKKWQKAS